MKAFLRNSSLKKWVLFICLFSSFLAFSQQADIQVVSYNIRLATDSDGENAWKYRKEKLNAFLREMQPDVFGLQEVLHEQLECIAENFPQFQYVGLARDDGKTLGEYSPVFYNKSKYSVLQSGTFWLSQTPEIAGSRGWDAACNRVVSYVGLHDLTTGKNFYVFNTHFDHMGELARKNSSLLLLKAVDSIAKNTPCIITGDFNSNQQSEPYKILTDPSNPKHFFDSRLIAEKIEGVDYSYTGFKVNGIQPELIDYIFIKGALKVKSFTIDNRNDGINYPSDHLPLKGIIQF